MESQGTRTYYATSAFTDPANWLTFGGLLLGLFAATTDIFPAYIVKLMVLGQGVLGLAARTFLADRPVAFISPGTMQPQEVKAFHPAPEQAAKVEQQDRATGGSGSTKPLVIAFLATSLLVVSCAKQPPGLTPQMKKTWQATEAATDLGVAVDAAIALHKTTLCKPAEGQPVNTATDCHPLLSRADRDVVLRAIDTALAVIDKTPENWKTAAADGLQTAETHLSALGKTKFLPYIQAARTAIALIDAVTGSGVNEHLEVHERVREIRALIAQEAF